MSTGAPSNGPRFSIGLMVIGSEMAGFTVVGVVLDRFVFGTMPWLTVGFTVLGFAAAFYHLILLTKGKTRSPGSSPPGGGVR